MSHRLLTVGHQPSGERSWSVGLGGGLVLSLLTEETREYDGTAKVDPAILDPAGPAGWMSITWAQQATLPFDDVAVSEALRRQLRGHPADLFSTLIARDDTLIGSITAVVGSRADQALQRLAGDAFARLLPRRIVAYPAGLFRPVPPPAGPVIQRYGSTRPWPADRF